MKKSSVLAGLACAATLVLGAASPTPAATSSPTAYSDCPANNVCFWTGSGGTGQRCSWDINDTNWHTAPSICSWAANTPVKSVYNRKSIAVRFYLSTNYNDRIGCTPAGVSGNLTGTYTVSSHQFTLC
ncbi:peptidase inhibitor family I36 protein [Streptomyces sp. AC627_RSS907]|uniref:peptidase inhibitor family I36 protein n=1 Tax=Streptomyces sp. AC627_RSS907 TaxID=2823684 RepID=UPI0020B8AB9D|nr:peptidase inhibitor family I36 protein [Streptomyces sp. AC627_RSS907]